MQSFLVADHYSFSWIGIGWLFSQQQSWSCGREGEGGEMFGGDSPMSSPISPSLSAAEMEKEKSHG
jgi:hypothetical protein